MHGTLRALCVLLTLLPFAASTHASDATGLVLSTGDGEPLVVDKFDYNPTDDWFSTLTLVVRNVSPKPVAYAEFTVELRQMQIDGRNLVLRLCYGDHALAETSRVDADAKPLAPTKTAKIKVMYDKWSAVAAQKKSTGAHYRGAAILQLHTVIFADGTRWTDGAS
jgi:hypothetical protein